MNKPEDITWWEKLCMWMGFTWDVKDSSSAPPAALQSTPAAPPALDIYAKEARLLKLKLELQRVSGLLLAERSYDHEIDLALVGGHAVIVEVAAKTMAVTVHSVLQEDIETFVSLAEWASFQCSGREGSFDSMFYRVDVKPFLVARECRVGCGAMFIPHLSIEHYPPKSEDDDVGGGGDGLAGGPVKTRTGPGEEPPPPLSKVRAPRSR